jgi:hypothetical protein
MYGIDIHYRGNRAKELSEPIAELLARCGFTFHIQVLPPSASASGGQIILKHLRFPKASQVLRGKVVYENDAQVRIHMLLHRLIKNKPFEGRVWFPAAEGRAAVRCSSQKHTLYHKDGHLVLCNHEGDKLELDLAMSALAHADKPPKCIRILDAWKRASTVEEDKCKITIPAVFKPTFRQAAWKHHFRQSIKANLIDDKLLLSREQRWHNTAYMALWKSVGQCKYPQKFTNTVNPVWTGKTQLVAVYVHTSSKRGTVWNGKVRTDIWEDRPKNCPTICLNKYEQIMPAMEYWFADTNKNDRVRYELHVFMPDIVEWYAKVYLRGAAVIDDSLILQSYRINDESRRVKGVRYWSTTSEMGLAEKYGVITKDENGNWKLRWDSDDPKQPGGDEKADLR